MTGVPQDSNRSPAVAGAHVKQSPILDLEASIAGAAFNVAPERADELMEAVPNITLELVRVPKFHVSVVVKSGEIRIGIATAEYLWATAAMLHELYRVFVAAQERDETHIDLSLQDAFCERLTLFRWALENLRGSGQAPWPDGSLRPQIKPHPQDDNDAMLAALGWILHHEIAHHRRKHRSQGSSIYSVQEETEADEDAVDWVFEKCPDKQLVFRQIAMLIGLMAIQYLEVPTGPVTAVGSHPPTTERLYRCLDRSGAAEDGVVRAFAAIAMHFQLCQHGLSAPLDGNSFQEIMDGALAEFVTARRKVSEL